MPTILTSPHCVDKKNVICTALPFPQNVIFRRMDCSEMSYLLVALLSISWLQANNIFDHCVWEKLRLCELLWPLGDLNASLWIWRVSDVLRMNSCTLICLQQAAKVPQLQSSLWCKEWQTVGWCQSVWCLCMCKRETGTKWKTFWEVYVYVCVWMCVLQWVPCDSAVNWNIPLLSSRFTSTSPHDLPLLPPPPPHLSLSSLTLTIVLCVLSTFLTLSSQTVWIRPCLMGSVNKPPAPC